MKKSKFSVKTIAICAMMFAITIIMSFTFLGTVPTPFVNASIAFLPTMVAVMLIGPAGMLVGVFAGLLSMIRAFTMPMGILGPYFQNPIISVFPRAMIGVTTYFSYRILGKTRVPDVIRVGLSAIIGSMTNTTLVLGLLYIIYARDIMAAAGDIMPGGVAVWLLGIAASNGLGEVAINAFLVTIVVLGMRKAGLGRED